MLPKVRTMLLGAGIFGVMAFLAPVAHAINISLADVQSGVAVVQGGKAAANHTITWESGNVATANKNGGFSFQGAVPSDCVGTLSDGVTTIDVALTNCTPVSEGGGVSKTGQTTCYDSAGNIIACVGTGQDGDVLAGTPLPSPRFTDNGNGTITDNLTGLIWLKNANCFGTRTWATALTDANTLADGACGLTDGSSVGDWYLPNRNELANLIHLGFVNPALSNTAGTAKWTTNGDAFDNVASSVYWSSTSYANDPFFAWFVFFFDGGVGAFDKADDNFVLPVRSGP